MAAEAATARVVAPGAINAGAFSAMPFSFSFTGDFSTLGDFFSRLERFVSLKGDQIKVSGRLLRVESINLTPGTDGWPGLTAQVGASSYIVPEAAEPTAPAQSGAVATTPATTTTTTTASTGSSGGGEIR